MAEASLVVEGVLGILDAILDLILSQIMGEGFGCHRIFQVILTPTFVSSIQMDRPGTGSLLQANVSIGFQELSNVVAVLHALSDSSL